MKDFMTRLLVRDVFLGLIQDRGLLQGVMSWLTQIQGGVYSSCEVVASATSIVGEMEELMRKDGAQGGREPLTAEEEYFIKNLIRAMDEISNPAHSRITHAAKNTIYYNMPPGITREQFEAYMTSVSKKLGSKP